MAELRPHELRRRTKMGRVVSNKMQKTVVVAVESMREHRLYGRNVRRTTKFKAHDEENRCQIGDVVVIAESRPISKEKWADQFRARCFGVARIDDRRQLRRMTGEL